MRVILAALASVLLIATEGHSQEDSTSSDIQVQMEPCGPTPPPVAAVTDLSTGKGIRLYSLDPALDKVPPCGGNFGQPAPIGTYQLPSPIPQLVKIRSSGGDCSGALVALSSTQTTMTRAVITAAHCVMSGSEFFRDFRIYPGFENGTNPEFGEIQGTEVLTFNGYTAAKQSSHDIAVIKLSRVIDVKYSPYGLSAFQNCKPASRAYFRPHYNPSIGDLKLQSMAEGTTNGCVDGMIEVGLPTGGGSSGSPVVDLYSRSVFAVHSQGTPTHSLEAPLTPAKLCAIISFLDNTNQLVCPPGANID